MKKIICMLLVIVTGSAIAQTKTVLSVYGEKVAYPPSTANTLSSANNTITSEINGVPSSTSKVNSVSNSSNGNALITTVNDVNSPPLDPAPLVKEPWQIMGGSLPATSNTDNIYQVGKVGIGDGNAALDEKLQVSGKTIFESSSAGALKIVDGTQGAGKVLTSDASGLSTWIAPGVLILEGRTPSSQVEFVTNGGSNYLGGYIDLPSGSWAINVGILVNPKIGDSTVVNSTYAGRLGFSSSDTSISDTNFTVFGSPVVLKYTTMNTVALKYPMFVYGVIRVKTTMPSTRLYLWNLESVGGALGGDEIGSVDNNEENYIFAIDINQ